MDKKDRLREILKNELFVTSDGHNSIAGVEYAIEIITDKYYLLEKDKTKVEKIKHNTRPIAMWGCDGTLYFVEEK